MRNALVFSWLSLAVLTATAGAQQATIVPQVRTKPTADSKITAIKLAAHFVTTIRVPEPVNSVVVGDPALFQVEHSEHEPELVFVKTLTNEHAESNLLISTARGRQISFLLVSRGEGPNSAKVDFLLRYDLSPVLIGVPLARVAVEDTVVDCDGRGRTLGEVLHTLPGQLYRACCAHICPSPKTRPFLALFSRPSLEKW
jgi:hypothetical protein